MLILIVNKSDLSIAHRYEADAPRQLDFGGPWGSSEQTTHIICSPAYDPECVSIEDQNGVLVAILDENKVEAKKQLLWQKFRSDRDMKLAKCDWTQMPDSPLNATDRAAWAAYRQELRDLPEQTEDPANPVWPSEPNVQI